MSKPVVAVSIGQKYYPRLFNELTWQMLTDFAEVIHHPGQEPAAKQDLIALLPHADAVITSWEVAQIDADVVAAAPKLKVMVHMGGSVKRFASDAVYENGISVLSARSALAADVAECALGFILVGMKRIFPLAKTVREGGWRESPYWPSREIHRKTVGIVGASFVGRHLIELLRPFEPARVLLYDPFVTDVEAQKMGVSLTDMDSLCAECDILSLHAPLTPATQHLINAEKLQTMKDNALIVNTARGGLIDEPALVAELQKGRFFAFLDVTDPEPPAADSPLRSLDNVVVTPHIAGCIEDCSRLSELASEELRLFFEGKPSSNLVTREMYNRIG
jgi:phosphoglycerate dehydrogenase-like enzyme